MSTQSASLTSKNKNVNISEITVCSFKIQEKNKMNKNDPDRQERRLELKNKYRSGHVRPNSPETKISTTPHLLPKRSEIIELISVFGAPDLDYSYLANILHFIPHCSDLQPGTICQNGHILDYELVKSLYDKIYLSEASTNPKYQQEQIQAIIATTYYLWQYRHYDQRLEDYLRLANRIIFQQNAPLLGSWIQLKQMIRYLEWNDDPFELGIDKYALGKLMKEHDYYHCLLNKYANYALKLINILPFGDESSFIQWKIGRELPYRKPDSGRINLKALTHDVKKLKTSNHGIRSAKQIAQKWLEREIFQLIMIRDLPEISSIIETSSACERRFYSNLSLIEAQADIDRLNKNNHCRKIIFGNHMCAPNQKVETEKDCYSCTLHNRQKN